MSVEYLSSNELDLLADYTADVLEGAQAAQVEHRIRTDPRWAAAYRTLVGADAEIRSALSGLPMPAMPADVANRIDTALRRGGLVAVPGGRTKSRRRRVYVGIASAAAAVVAVVAGIGIVGPFSQKNASTTSAAADQRAGAAPQAAVPTVPLNAAGAAAAPSNIDYDRDSLAALARAVASGTNNYAATGDKAAQPVPAPAGSPESDTGANPLARLADPAALTACVEAVLRTHPGVVVGPATFARFDHQPAVIIVIRQSGGTSTAVAVGPNCGLGGTDEKAAVSAP